MTQSLQYSAELDIYLLVGCRRIEVESCFGNKCTLRTPFDIPPSYAELVIVIDGEERRRPVFLKKGISQELVEVELSHPDSLETHPLEG